MENANKKLVKGSDKKIAGVCSGVAEYCNIDTTWVRIGWVILSLFYGVGILAYVVGAILMPNE